MSTILTIYVNTDTTDDEYGESGVEWTQVDTDNDYLIFSTGSATVADGESLPSASDLNQAGTLVSESEVTVVSKCFLADVGSNLLREIHNAGNQNKRYVFCFSFDGSTSSEPVLELWDDDGLDSTDLYSLGEGTPADSWWKGVVTTDALPGADWATGAPITLAGSTAGHFLYLNNESGALSVAKDLYCNLAIVIPINPTQSALEEPVFVIKCTKN